MLSQRQLDLLGLALLAFAALFAFILYFGWDGGQAGEAMADGFRYLLGDVAYAVPLVLLGAGAATILRPMLPSVRPFRAGAACLICALALGLAAGSLGLGPGDTPRDGFLDASYLEQHGGLFGDSLYVAAKTLFQEVGAQILFAFLAIAGVLLITGGSIAGVIAATGRRVATTTARVRGGATARLPEAARPPEVEPVVRATHVEAPALDGVERYPDLLDGDPGPERGAPGRGPRLGPGGRGGAARAGAGDRRRAGPGRAAAARAADADGEPPLGRDRGRRRRLQAAAGRRSSSAPRLGPAEAGRAGDREDGRPARPGARPLRGRREDRSARSPART